MGSSFSIELNIYYGVSQVCVLAPFLFNIDIYDFFYVDITSDIVNYADDTTLYECDQYSDSVISNLELTVDKIVSWLEYNNMKANASKAHFFLSPNQHTSININGSVIKSSNCDKLLGITIDNDFTFKIITLLRKASQKLHVMSRISQYLSQHKKRILFKVFITSQFKYCLLVWMCHNIGLNN